MKITYEDESGDKAIITKDKDGHYDLTFDPKYTYANGSKEYAELAKKQYYRLVER